MNLSVFSTVNREGGPDTNGARFDVLLCSLHYTPQLFDVLGIVRNVTTGEVTHRLFRNESSDQHAQAAVEWVGNLLDLTDPLVLLRSPGGADAE